MVRFSNTFFTIGTLDLGLMIAYVFGRYSGNYPEFISMIDGYAETLWLFVSILTYKYILHVRVTSGGGVPSDTATLYQTAMSNLEE